MKYRLPDKMILDDKTRSIYKEKGRKLIHQFKSDDEIASIKIYGKERNVSYLWLYGIVITKIVLPDYSDIENNVSFYWYSGPEHPEPILKTKFKKPYELSVGDRVYRVCPDATAIMLTADGKHVINWCTGNYLNQHLATNGYYYVVYSHKGFKPTKRRVHRCVAYAWVENETPEIRYSINHIDHNPKNNHYTNLEWCTGQENVIHAYYSGKQHSAATACRARDIFTGEIIEASSIAQMEKITGIKSFRFNPTSTYLRNPIIGGRYEFRTAGDDTPWLLEGINVIRRDNEACGKRLYIINRDGVKYGYMTEKSLCELGLGVKRVSIKTLNHLGGKMPYAEKVVTKIRDFYPGIDISFIELFNDENTIVRNIETGEETVHQNIGSIQKMYKVYRGQILHALYHGKPFHNKYIVIQKKQ